VLREHRLARLRADHSQGWGSPSVVASGRLELLRTLSASYQVPCLRPNHQINPSVAVLWSLL
jgi:hypothetical protein